MPPRLSWNSPGCWTQVVAVSHAAVAIVVHRRAYAGMGRMGVIASVPDHGPRAEAFWFAVPAPLLFALGQVLRTAEANGDIVTQRTAGVVLSATGAAGSVLMPASPFWAVFAVGLAALARSRRAKR
jgi:hypothetical protein